TFVKRALNLLADLNRILEPYQAGFAYRLRDEALMFIANSFDADGSGLFDLDPARNVDVALDLQILQKMLPRMSGTYDQAAEASRGMLVYVAPESEANLSSPRTSLAAVESAASASRYPRSARKLVRMLSR